MILWDYGSIGWWWESAHNWYSVSPIAWRGYNYLGDCFVAVCQGYHSEVKMNWNVFCPYGNSFSPLSPWSAIVTLITMVLLILFGSWMIQSLTVQKLSLKRKIGLVVIAVFIIVTVILNLASWDGGRYG
jgi:MFS superfamily sulfate permease-like transporter